MEVAILIHDFPGLSSEGTVLDGEGADKTYSRTYSRTYAVTLYGRAYVLEDGPDSERLREKHLARQPESAVFIKVGRPEVRACESTGVREGPGGGRCPRDQPPSCNAAGPWLSSQRALASRCFHPNRATTSRS